MDSKDDNLTTSEKIKRIELAIQTSKTRLGLELLEIDEIGYDNKKFQSRVIELFYDSGRLSQVFGRDILQISDKIDSVVIDTHKISKDASMVAWIGFAAAFVSLGITIINYLPVS